MLWVLSNRKYVTHLRVNINNVSLKAVGCIKYDMDRTSWFVSRKAVSSINKKTDISPPITIIQVKYLAKYVMLD